MIEDQDLESIKSEDEQKVDQSKILEKGGLEINERKDYIFDEENVTVNDVDITDHEEPETTNEGYI